MEKNGGPSIQLQVTAALMYGISSLLIMFVNKGVFSLFGFPSSHFLAFSQFVATLLVLVGAKFFKIISYSDLSMKHLKSIFPLPILFWLNCISGLASTKSLNIPMLTVLRRFSIVMTMIAEYFILRIHPSYGVQIGVFCMILGAVIAALNDLTFDLRGYISIFFNDILTAANGVTSKQKLEEKELGVYGVMLYNSLFSIIFSLTWGLLNYEAEIVPVLEFNQWHEVDFLSTFLLSCFMGFVLNYSIIFCTKVNSPLTTTVVGSLKNIFSTYLGMLMGGYLFTWYNFLGLNVSVLGSLIYSSVKYKEQQSKKAPTNNLPK